MSVCGHICAVQVHILMSACLPECVCVRMCVGIMIVRFIIMAANEIISKFTFQLSVGSAGERERSLRSSIVELLIVVLNVSLCGPTPSLSMSA